MNSTLHGTRNTGGGLVDTAGRMNSTLHGTRNTGGGLVDTAGRMNSTLVSLSMY
jgi:hypothetical protein